MLSAFLLLIQKLITPPEYKSITACRVVAASNTLAAQSSRTSTGSRILLSNSVIQQITQTTAAIKPS